MKTASPRSRTTPATKADPRPDPVSAPPPPARTVEDWRSDVRLYWTVDAVRRAAERVSATGLLGPALSADVLSSLRARLVADGAPGCQSRDGWHLSGASGLTPRRFVLDVLRVDAERTKRSEWSAALFPKV